MGLSVLLWQLRRADGRTAQCEMETRDDQSVQLTLVDGNKTFPTESFSGREPAIERCIRLYRELNRDGWLE
jgi:hypothetical protein